MEKSYQNKTIMKLSKLVLLLVSISLFSCANKESKPTTKEEAKPAFNFGVWTTANAKKSNEEYSAEFQKYKNAGIDEVLINTNTDPELLKRLVPLGN